MATKKKKGAKKKSSPRAKKKGANPPKKKSSKRARASKVSLLVTEKGRCLVGNKKSYSVKLRRGRDVIHVGELFADTLADAKRKAKAYVKKQL